MLEDIKVYLMESWKSNRKKIDKYEDGVLPNMKKKIVRESAYTNNWLVRYVFYCECYCKSFYLSNCESCIMLIYIDMRMSMTMKLDLFLQLVTSTVLICLGRSVIVGNGY